MRTDVARVSSLCTPMVIGLLLTACSGDGGRTPTTEDRTAPTVTITSSTTSEGSAYLLTGTASDDVGVVALAYRVNQSAEVAVAVAAAFTVELTLPVGDNNLRVEAADDAGNIGFAEVTVTVVPAVNTAPIAEAARVTLDEDTPTEIALAATDPEGDALTFAIVDDPGHGTLSGSPPALTYTPEGDFAGVDSFSFRANDGELDSAPAVVTLQITAVNDAPVAENGEATTDEDTPVEVDLVASDVDDDGIGYRVVEPPAHGQVDLANAPSAIYTPDADYAGPDSFTFAADDGFRESVPALIDITVRPVNDGPVALDDALETREDTPVTFDLAAIDIDTEAGALAFTVISGPDAGAGTLDIANLPTLTFSPSSDYVGSASLTFEVSDGEAADTATVSLTVLEGSVLFVDVAGSDTNHGHSEDQPLRTLAAALIQADRVGSGEVLDTIQLAPGRYCEPGGAVMVDRSVIIVGAGMDETILDGSSLALDCPDPHADGYVSCDERAAMAWPSDGVIEVSREPADVDPEPALVAIADLTIANGLSHGWGGGLRNIEVLSLERVRVADNCAEDGGGIYNTEPELAFGVDPSPWAVLTLDGCVVERNRATSGGGGLYNRYGRLSLTDTQVVDNEVRLGDEELGRFASGGGILSEEGQTDSELRISLSSISRNTVAATEFAEGGAIAASNAIDIADAVIEDNQALVSASGTSVNLLGYAQGGGLFLNGPAIRLSNTQIERNLAEAIIDVQVGGTGAGGVAGGGLYTDAAADLSLEGVRIANNVARSQVGAYALAEAIVDGAGMYVISATTSIAGTEIEDNDALAVSASESAAALSEVRGGGAFFQNAAVTLDAVVIAGNRARSDLDAPSGLNGATQLGGGLSVLFGSVTLTNTTIRENVVQVVDANRAIFGFAGLGGGMSVVNAVMTADALVVESNRAPRGGGLALEDSEAWITDSQILGNGANNRGGGIYAVGSVVSVAESTLSGNSARHDADIGALPELDKSGGGLYMSGGTLEIFDTEISDNESDRFAGGLVLLSVDTLLEGTTIVGNSTPTEEGASGGGGGINALEGSLIVRGSSIADNRSPTGGGIVATQMDLELDTSTVSGNTAAGSFGRGGGLYLLAAVVEITNSTLSGNTATGDFGTGAAIFNNSSEVNVILSTVHDNGLSDRGEAALVHEGSGFFFTFLTLVGDNVPASCNDGEFYSGGYNLDYDGSCALNEFGDLNRTGPEPWDLRLTALANNGGLTLTHAPLSGSPVIDAHCPFLPIDQDQRGSPRPVDGDANETACHDIGAVEYP